MSQPNLIFFHIPKTAGSTILSIAKKNYKRNEIFTIDGLDYKSSINQLMELNEDQKRKIKLIQGHRTLYLDRSFAQPFRYFTYLREPVDLFVSSFYYIKQTPVHKYHDVVKSMNSIEDFARFRKKNFQDNLQTRHLAAIATDMEPGSTDINSKSGNKHFEKAKDNLDVLIDLVFLTEKLDESLLYLKEFLGWKYITYERKNQSLDRPKVSDLSNREIDIISEISKFDIELYEAAESKHNKLLSTVPNLGLKIARFRKTNNIKQKLNRVYSLLNYK